MPKGPKYRSLQSGDSQNNKKKREKSSFSIFSSAISTYNKSRDYAGHQ